jgi:diacylglycerol kinase (ATP)
VRALVVYNPRAANGRARSLLPKVRGALEARGVEAEWLVTERSGHAVELVAEADLGSFDAVVAAGGDGTVFETVNGYFRNPADEKAPFGVLPIGTGNAYARDLGLQTRQLERAAELIAGSGRRHIDVARFTTAGEPHYFLNILGLGFVSDVGERAHRLKLFGNLSYTLAVVLETLTLRSYPMAIELDGQLLERDNIFCEISNTRYTSNFLMAPEAKIDDGLLDVTLLGPLTRRRLLTAFPKVFSGEHVHLDEVESFQARSIRIRTEEPKVLAPDGEVFGTSPVEIECLHRALEVFAEGS